VQQGPVGAAEQEDPSDVAVRPDEADLVALKLVAVGADQDDADRAAGRDVVGVQAVAV
jgi:hypothetical protein